jgi:hypothetical protein
MQQIKILTTDVQLSYTYSRHIQSANQNVRIIDFLTKYITSVSVHFNLYSEYYKTHDIYL